MVPGSSVIAQCAKHINFWYLFAQSCLTLCDPMDCSPPPPGSSVHGILQGRIMEWVACPSPADLCNPGIERRSPALQADSSLSEPPGKPKNTGVVVYPFSRGSSQPKNQTGISCIAGRFFTSQANRETQKYSVHRILQARILECDAMPFSRGSSQPRGQTQVSCTAGGFFIV